jgi:DNA polymerase III subunit beta
LRNIPGEEIRMSFKAPERAALLEPEGVAGPGSYVCLVMPLRLLD